MRFVSSQRHHRVTSMEVDVRVFVQRQSARNPFEVALVLNGLKSHRQMRNFCSLNVRENSELQDRRNVVDQADVLKFGERHRMRMSLALNPSAAPSCYGRFARS